MDPIAVDVRLIKAVLGTELKIAPGRVLMARVVSADGAGRGTLNIAGTTLEAELPKAVQSGQELRLTVRHVSPERVELSMSDPAATTATATAALPGGGAVQVTKRDALRYDAPALGPIDLQFDLDSRSLQLTATFAAGDSVERAQDAAGQLQSALGGALGRPVRVDIKARREPLDVYA
jgi:hypothetical protein